MYMCTCKNERTRTPEVVHLVHNTKLREPATNWFILAVLDSLFPGDVYANDHFTYNHTTPNTQLHALRLMYIVYTYGYAAKLHQQLHCIGQSMFTPPTL